MTSKKIISPACCVNHVTLLLLCWIIGFSPLFRAEAQSQKYPHAQFYVGTAEAVDVETARLRAYQNLVQQIQVFVSSTLRRTLTENNASVSDSSSATTITTSLLTLRDVEEEVDMQPGSMYRVRKYVARETVRKMFGERKQRILDHLHVAGDIFHPGREAYDVSSALKNLYAASLELTLYPDTIGSTFALFDERHYGISQAGITSAINAIAGAIKFDPVRLIDDDNIVWKYGVSLNGHPVSSLLVNFYDGMGQTDVDVSGGSTMLTFYFNKNDRREKNVTAYVEYRFEEELDPMLRIADSLQSGGVAHPSFIITVPACLQQASPDKISPIDPMPAPKTETVSAEAKTLPQPLRVLLDVKNDFNAIVHTLDELQRHHAVIAGSAKSFESLDGLYGLVVARGEDAILIHRQREHLTNIETGSDATMEQFAGKRIIWIEVLN
jgi:hypothetical protein